MLISETEILSFTPPFEEIYTSPPVSSGSSGSSIDASFISGITLSIAHVDFSSANGSRQYGQTAKFSSLNSPPHDLQIIFSLLTPQSCFLPSRIFHHRIAYQ